MPIRLRVTAVFTIVMAVVLLIGGLLIQERFRAQLDATLDQGLRTRAEEVAALVRQSDTGLRESTRSILTEQGESAAQVLTPAGQIFDTTPQLGPRPLLSGAKLRAAVQGPIFVERAGVGGLNGSSRLLATPLNAQGERLIVVVATSLEDHDDALENLSSILLIGGPVGLLIVSIVGYVTVVAALRPVEAMRRRAAEISAAEPDGRLPVPPAADELRCLGETLNAMLARLQEALERERAFVDDASHELRTPLAMHRTELELALRYVTDPEELRAAIASAIEEAERLSQLAEDLLVLARSDKGRLEIAPQPTEIGELLGEVGERFTERAVAEGRSILVEPSPRIEVDANRQRLAQALGNLVENALRHGRGPVRLWTEIAPGAVRLHVCDEGEGFPPDFLPRAFERFSRAEAARSSPGSGLGLAIVEAIAVAHGGSAAAGESAGGGADVWIELPFIGLPL